MALGFNGLDALVNVGLGKYFLLLINHSCIHTKGLDFLLQPNTPETYQILSKKAYQDDWLSP